MQYLSVQSIKIARSILPSWKQEESSNIWPVAYSHTSPATNLPNLKVVLQIDLPKIVGLWADPRFLGILQWRNPNSTVQLDVVHCRVVHGTVSTKPHFIDSLQILNSNSVQRLSEMSPNFVLLKRFWLHIVLRILLWNVYSQLGLTVTLEVSEFGASRYNTDGERRPEGVLIWSHPAWRGKRWCSWKQY